MTFPLAVWEFGFGFYKTLILTNTGGIAGIFFFTYLSDRILKLWRRYFPGKNRDTHDNINGNRKNKLFTQRNRRIVKVKAKYGLAGIAVMTPVLLSIPVGVFLTVRYFRPGNPRFIYLATANLIWSLLYTSFYLFCHDLYLYW